MSKVLAEEVCIIAIEAGKIIMDIYDNVTDFGVEAKADDSPLTIADKAANDIIVAGLEKLAQQYPIISEENKQVEYADRKDYNKFWLVDPLDGTKEFIKRNGEFTVNIALIEDGYPVLGVVYVPAIDVVYFSAKGEGAFKIVDGKEIKIKTSAYDISDTGLRVVCSRSHVNADTQNFLDNLNKPEIVSKGSSLKFLIIAEGEADLYPRLGPTMEWDTGAAQAVLEEAGGSIIHNDNKQRLNYNKESLLNPYFIASGNS